MAQKTRIKRIEKAMQRYFESQAEQKKSNQAKRKLLIRMKNNWTRGSTKDFKWHKDLSRIEKDRHATEQMPQSSNSFEREKDTS